MKTTIFKCFTFVVLLLSQYISYSQTIRTVGNTGANYSTLKAAFDDINAGTITGDIVLQVIANTTETVGPVVLYQSGSTNALNSNYNSVLIYPTSAGLSISGSLNSAIVSLNEADNVTIDGRVNQTGTTPSLTIENTNNANGASAIWLGNHAESNTIKYCNIKACNTSPTSGIIHFTTSIAGSGNGNSNNTIEYNNISGTSNADNGRSNNAIYSAGTAGSLNSNNLIRNNNFFNHHRLSVSSNAIHVAANSPNWIISGNSFYETAAITVTNNTATNKRDYMIFINANTSGGSIISSNFIGGRGPECSGLAYTVAGSPSQYNFRPIYVNTGNTAITTIENNIIRNISLSNINSTQTGENIRVFTGIDSYRSNVNINKNQIGSNSGNSSIVVSVAAGTASHQYITAGITNDPPFYQGQITISNNIIGSIDAINTTTNGRHDFYGIYETLALSTNYGTNFQITGNIIGGTTANSIRAPRTDNTDNSASTIVAGIHLRGAANFTIANNTVRNIRQQSTGSGAIVYGLFTSAASPHTIDGNEIYNITSAGTNSTPSTQGIRLQGQTTGQVHVRNNIVLPKFRTTD